MKTLGLFLPAVVYAGNVYGQSQQRLVPIIEHAVSTLALAGSPDFLALADSTAWVTNEGRVEHITAGSTTPLASVRVAQPCGAMGVGFGSLWVVDCHDRTLVRISLQSARRQATISTGVADPRGELSVAVGAGSVWLLTDSSGVLSRIDPRTNRVVARIRVKPRSYAAVYGFGSVWVTNTGVENGSPGSVQRVDPSTNSVSATIHIGPTPRFLAAGEGSVWTLNQGDGTVTRIDPVTNDVVATIDVGVPGSGGDIATGAKRVWVRATRVLLSVIDPRTNVVLKRFGPAAGSGAVRASDRFVWITAHDIQRVWVIRP
jgi:virginiamycin B lyase